MRLFMILVFILILVLGFYHFYSPGKIDLHRSVEGMKQDVQQSTDQYNKAQQDYLKQMK